jgi:catechol 2,3-dioxygenase-like lactoylglutathione lyase family enzyme
MPVELDHLILKVNDREASIAFYTHVLGFRHEGERGPFSVLRVTDRLTLQLAPWGSTGGEHLAFAMTRGEFDDVVHRVKEGGIAYGDAFDTVGNGRGPGDEEGAQGNGKALYFFDPSHHLIEIRHYSV